jgi:nucleoside-diphosphate-sugar epimerase
MVAADVLPGVWRPPTSQENLMHVFVTGASGWIGSAVVPELIGAGHQVTGLARSDASAQTLTTAGAQVVRGSIDDLDVLREAARAADGVIHLAFKHDLAFTGQMDVAADADLAVIRTIGDALAGSDRPFLFASGIAGLTPGELLTEADRPDAQAPATARVRNEAEALELAGRGVRVAAVRLAPTNHGEGDNGFMTYLASIARAKGVSGYVADGANRWCAVNRADTAVLIRLGLESVPAGAILHAVGEPGVTTREIAEALAAGLGIEAGSVPADRAGEHFGWIGGFFGLDMPASSQATQQLLGWTPTHPGLIADIEAGYYTA